MEGEEKLCSRSRKSSRSRPRNRPHGRAPAREHQPRAAPCGRTDRRRNRPPRRDRPPASRPPGRLRGRAPPGHTSGARRGGRPGLRRALRHWPTPPPHPLGAAQGMGRPAPRRGDTGRPAPQSHHRPPLPHPGAPRPDRPAGHSGDQPGPRAAGLRAGAERPGSDPRSQRRPHRPPDPARPARRADRPQPQAPRREAAGPVCAQRTRPHPFRVRGPLRCVLRPLRPPCPSVQRHRGRLRGRRVLRAGSTHRRARQLGISSGPRGVRARPRARRRPRRCRPAHGPGDLGAPIGSPAKEAQRLAAILNP